MLRSPAPPLGLPSSPYVSVRIENEKVKLMLFTSQFVFQHGKPDLVPWASELINVTELG